MKPVVVTVVGPRARRDLSLPSDVAVGSVLPTLIQLTGGVGESGDWRLTDANGRVISTEQTLVAAGVDDGAVVVLDRRRMGPVPNDDGSALETLESDGLDPREGTRRLLPTEHGIRRRLGDAFGAMFSEGEGNRPGPLTRMRRQWKDSSPEATLARVATEMATGRSFRIGVVSVGSGSGATLVTRLLASTLGNSGHGRTVAVDTDNKTAALSHGATSPQPLRLTDVASRLSGPALSYSEVDRRLARDSLGLRVVTIVPGGPQVDRTGLGDAIDGLSRHCGMVVVDAGRAESTVGRAALSHVDLTVLVSSVDEDEAALARAAGATMSAGRPVVTVVNKCRGADAPDELISLLGHSAAVITLPPNVATARLVDAGQFRWDDTTRGWRIRFLRLAAVVCARLDPVFNEAAP